MAATAGRVEVTPRVEARGVGLRAGLVTVAFLVLAVAVGLAVGAVHIGLGPIVRSALSYVPLLHVHQPLDAVDRAVLWQLRAPRVALAALVGGMLAVAGASYQGVFRNPLCDPYLLGVAGGAGLGATLAIVYASAAAAGGSWTVPLAAFAGAIGAVVVTYALGRSAGAAHMTGALVLAGVTMATFTAAVQTFVQQQHTQQLQNVYAWLLGGFSTATWRDVAICAPYVAVSSLVLVLHRRREGRHRHAGQHECSGHVCRADRSAERVRDDDGSDRPGERRERHRPVASRCRCGGVDDRECRAESGSAGHAEQIRVAERVPEHTLVRRACDGEHPADECAERDAWGAHLPDHSAEGLVERLVNMEERDVRERRMHDRPDGNMRRPDCEPDGERAAQEQDRGQTGAEADTPRLDAGCNLELCRCRHQPLRAIRATARANWTIRGPQREAMSSSTPTTRPRLTAAIALQPGLAATVASLCWQHFVSARTMICGFCWMMYSAESCGY